MADITHVYTSDLGEDFLNWHEWAITTLDKDDLNVYLAEDMSDEKIALYDRWIIEQKIITHTILEDGKVKEVNNLK